MAPQKRALSALPSSAAGSQPTLVPYLYLDGGKVVQPASGQFEPVREVGGAPVDPFEAADRLVAAFQRVCVIDLDGIRRNRPQLDYLQELSRSGELWVDAGVRTGEQMIDILVTGAQRVVLSTAYLLSPRELKRAWRLSPELLFAVEVDGTVVRRRGNDWDGQATPEAIAGARQVGVIDVILRSRDGTIDWPLVSQLAKQGPLWVGDASDSDLQARLTSAGAKGGLFDPPRPLLLGAPDGPDGEEGLRR
jgi:phosphoribosylformimino-5-aminoimidazole carboxamide ribonucleotide (ProFAR) isomerase